MEKITNFYKNKKILITGVTGFKGSWLCMWLLCLNAKIIGIGNNSKKKHKFFDSLKLSKNINLIFFDIRNREKLNKVIKDFKPSIVFHLAAQPIVLETFKRPYETVDVNVRGTLNIIDLCSKYKFIKSVVNVTSAHCYENRNMKNLKENDKLGGGDPYSASKASAELLISAYRKNYYKNKGISSVRSSNIIGGGDWSKNRLIPDCIDYLRKNKKIILRNPNYIRPWQFILEPLKGYLILAKKQYFNPKKYSSDWNFGPKSKDCKNVISLANQIIKIWGKGSLKIVKSEFTENKYLNLNSQKARKNLNWLSIYGVDLSVNKTIEWYDKVINGKIDPAKITKNQILDYMKSCKWI